MRGEKSKYGSMYGPLLGSPPHARGKDGKRQAKEPKHRITPACAGKRQRIKPSCAKWGDHPRMRGEKVLYPDKLVRVVGSPPHARGKGACSTA